MLKPLYQYDDKQYSNLAKNSDLIDRWRSKTNDRISMEIDVRQLENSDIVYVIVLDGEYLGFTRSEKEATMYLDNAGSFEAYELWEIADIGEEKFLANSEL